MFTVVFKDSTNAIYEVRNLYLLGGDENAKFYRCDTDETDYTTVAVLANNKVVAIDYMWCDYSDDFVQCWYAEGSLEFIRENKLSPKERLEEVRNLIKQKDWVHADMQIDEIYQDYSKGLWLSADESRWMFLMLNQISHHIYG